MLQEEEEEAEEEQEESVANVQTSPMAERRSPLMSAHALNFLLTKQCGNALAAKARL